jgi:L-iditol 2-dehydrogenase
MKIAVCEESKKIVIKETEEPKFKQDEVLVKVKSVGISHLDVLAYMGRYSDIKYPIILGSEFYGEVVGIGKKVENLEIGDEVIGEPLLSCEKCESCLSGTTNLCRNNVILGLHKNGAFAEYLAIKSALTHRKDESMSSDEAVLISPLATSIHAIKQADISIGDLVVIFGAGCNGLLTLQVAKRAGISVIVMDEDSERLHLSADLGADYVVSPLSNDAQELIMAITKDKGVKYIFECSGNLQNLTKAIDLVCKSGKIVMMEWTGNDIDQLPLTKIMANEISLIGLSTNCKNFALAIELVNSGLINLNSIVSHDYEFNEIPNAFEELSKGGSDIVKAIIRFAEEED